MRLIIIGRVKDTNYVRRTVLHKSKVHTQLRMCLFELAYLRTALAL